MKISADGRANHPFWLDIVSPINLFFLQSI